MTRDIDRAIDNSEHITEMRIDHIRKQAGKKEALPRGRCLFCGESLSGDERWCDSDCRDDWDHEQKMKLG